MSKTTSKHLKLLNNTTATTRGMAEADLDKVDQLLDGTWQALLNASEMESKTLALKLQLARQMLSIMTDDYFEQLERGRSAVIDIKAS